MKYKKEEMFFGIKFQRSIVIILQLIRKSYRAAQKALQKEEEQTFKENEVDSILPNGIDK